MSNVNDSPWTKDADRRLRELYAQGLSDYAIADILSLELGNDFTRDAVKNYAARASLTKSAIFLRESRFENVVIDSAPNGYRVVIFGDLHRPFHDKKTVRGVSDFMRFLEPNLIIEDGDGQDFYELSQFDKNPQRQHSLQDELDIGRAMLGGWHRDHPNARKIYIGGNHEDRLRRWLWRYGHLHSLRSLRLEELLDIKDTWEYYAYGSTVNFLGFLVEHGQRVRSAAGASARAMYEFRGSSGLCGHTHRFGVFTRRDSRGTHSYIENGCLCSLEAVYTPQPDWHQAFTYGFAQDGRFHWVAVPIYRDGFRAEGKWWGREE